MKVLKGNSVEGRALRSFSRKPVLRGKTIAPGPNFCGEKEVGVRRVEKMKGKKKPPRKKKGTMQYASMETTRSKNNSKISCYPPGAIGKSPMQGEISKRAYGGRGCDEARGFRRRGRRGADLRDHCGIGQSGYPPFEASVDQRRKSGHGSAWNVA